MKKSALSQFHDNKELQTSVLPQRYNLPVVGQRVDQRALPLGYSVLGREPDQDVLCDSQACQEATEENLRRLTCGHTFHTACLAAAAQGEQPQAGNNDDGPRVPGVGVDFRHAPNSSYACPICRPWLEERVKKLSRKFNEGLLHRVDSDSDSDSDGDDGGGGGGPDGGHGGGHDGSSDSDSDGGDSPGRGRNCLAPESLRLCFEQVFTERGTPRRLAQHLSRQSRAQTAPTSTAQQPMFACQTCGKTCRSKGGLTLHQKQHTK